MKRGFTLLELIIVVLIIGVLATLGFAQYARLIEGARGGEARDVIGAMRKMALAFYIKNGNTLTPAPPVAPLAGADLGIGPGGIPAGCSPTHYFSYGFAVGGVSAITFNANRCAAGGKTPDATAAVPNAVTLATNFVTGADNWVNIAPY